jgi:carboxymethylenebutenolidase
MPPITQDIINLYDRFTHGHLDRRDFMERLSAIVGVAATGAVIASLASDPARAQTIAPNDPRILSERVTFPGPDGAMAGLLVTPTGTARHGAVIVIHENRGLVPHIQDVTRRVAVAGFVALGVDALHPDGGTPTDEDRGRDMIGRLSRETAGARIAAAIPFLAAHARSNGRVGAVGFCWGGGMVNELAARAPDLAAGVVYYGIQPDLARVPGIRAALMIHYAGNDERINAGAAAYEAALRGAGKTIEQHVYPGTQHAFNNETSEARFDRAAATLAWERTIGWFLLHLAG